MHPYYEEYPFGIVCCYDDGSHFHTEDMSSMKRAVEYANVKANSTLSDQDFVQIVDNLNGGKVLKVVHRGERI